jgi:hypothetical protein
MCRPDGLGCNVSITECATFSSWCPTHADSAALLGAVGPCFGKAENARPPGDGMWNDEWMEGPFGLDAVKGQTFPTQRTVLVAVHSITAATRLSDVWPLLVSDHRIQLVFTRPPGALMATGTDRFLERLGGAIAPWKQAVQVRFDLAIAASYGQLERLHAPVLALSHGIGFSKLAVRYEGFGNEAPLEVAGMEHVGLVFHGRVIPSAIVLPTARDREILANDFPEAARAAVVGGDPCYDRLGASLHLREVYRRTLGVQDRKLVVVTSTWGAGSLLETHPDIMSQLARQLSATDYRLAAIVHPNAWAWHGSLQVRAWCAEATRHGLILVDPDDGWRAVLAAADCLIGDQGSVTAYGAAIGVPVLFGSSPTGHVMPGSPIARLAEMAPCLKPGPLAAQVDAVMSSWPRECGAVMRGCLTDVPGQSARILRRVMYQLMDLSEPGEVPSTPPVPGPRTIGLYRGEAA